MRLDRIAGIRLDQPMNAADMRDLIKRGGADLAHLQLARALHARRQDGVDDTKPETPAQESTR